MRIFGLGPTELMIILAILLLLFGPKQIPKLAKMFGKAAKDLKDGFEGPDENETSQQAIPPASAEQNETKTPSKKEETTS